MEIADDSSRLATCQFERIGIDFLGHDRASGAEGLRKFQESKFGGRPQDPFLGPTAQVRCDHAQNEYRFDGEIPIAADIDAVGRKRFKAEQLGRHLSIDRHACTSDCRAPEWAAIDPASAVGKTRSIALEFFHVSQPVVGCEHRLCPLHVGVGRQDDSMVQIASREKCSLELL